MCVSSDAQQLGLRVNSSHGGGAMIYENETVLMSEGMYHIVIMSNTSAVEDSHKVMWYYNKLWKRCDYAVHAMGEEYKCGAILFEVRDSCIKAVKQMENVSKLDLTSIVEFYTIAFRIGTKDSRPDRERRNIEDPVSRVKRSKGWFWRKIEWAFDFGTNDSDEGMFHDRSAGIVVHTIEGVKAAESSLVRHENLLQEEISKLHREVEYQKSRGAYRDLNAVESQFDLAANVIKSYVPRVLDPYLGTPVLDSDLYRFIAKINLKVADKGARVRST